MDPLHAGRKKKKVNWGSKKENILAAYYLEAYSCWNLRRQRSLGTTNTRAGKHWPEWVAIKLQGMIWTTDAGVWKWAFRWFWKNGAMIPQNTISASHPALGYKHWQGHRQRSNREKERRVLLKGFPPLCGGGIQKGTSDDYGAIYYDTVNTHNGHNGHGKNLAWEHNFN